jgi:hypothetical protein
VSKRLLVRLIGPTVAISLLLLEPIHQYLDFKQREIFTNSL